MDIVITYVNGLDPEWQQEYAHHTQIPLLEKRFRDWGTLRYLFRGIATYLPFIRRVHLVVARESQVPAWINRSQVNVVYHRDIIPAAYLPTFNSNTIEMHLHRIADLDEEYLYFNDDIFPVKMAAPTDFFRGGKAVLGMSRHLFAGGMFKKICRNSDKMARQALGLRPSLCFLRPQHVCAPMIKSACEQVYERLEPAILASLTAVRSERNLTQYLFTDYLYLQGKLLNERLSKKQFSVAVTSISRLQAFLEQPTHKLVCINDVKLSEERYQKMREMILRCFQEKFPNKSPFENE